MKSILDQTEIAHLKIAMETKYLSHLRGRRFEIETYQKDEFIVATITLSDREESFVYPVEGRLDFETENLSKRDASLFLIDYIDIYFEDYFNESEALFIPIDWADHELDDIQLQLKGQIRNLKMEREADKILAESASKPELN